MLAIPLVTQCIDLICKFCKIFVCHPLTLADNCNQTLSCNHKAVKYTWTCTVYFLLLHILAASLCNLLTGKQIICIPAIWCCRIKSNIIFNMFCKFDSGTFLTMYDKYFLRRILRKSRNPFRKMFSVRVSTDTWKIYNICFYFDLFTKQFYFLDTVE